MWAENAGGADFPGRDGPGRTRPEHAPSFPNDIPACQTTKRSAAVVEGTGSVGSEVLGASGDGEAAVAGRLGLAAEEAGVVPEAAVPLRGLQVKAPQRMRRGSDG